MIIVLFTRLVFCNKFRKRKHILTFSTFFPQIIFPDDHLPRKDVSLLITVMWCESVSSTLITYQQTMYFQEDLPGVNDVVLGTDTEDLTSFSYFQSKITFLNFKLQSVHLKVKLWPRDSPIKNWLISTRLNTEKSTSAGEKLVWILRILLLIRARLLVS